MNKAFKYRIYPNAEQKNLLLRTFGCCRKIWNLMLADKNAGIKNVTPAMYKDAYPFLREVDSLALCNVQLNLNKAIRDSFTVSGRNKPRFKSRKRSKHSYTTNNQNGSIFISDGKIRLPKAGFVKAVIHREIPDDHAIKSVTVSMDGAGAFYCSVLTEYERRVTPVERPELNAVGLDYKSDGFYVSSDGETCGSPKCFRKSEPKLAHAQKLLSRKKHGSNNYYKQLRRVCKIHKKTSNQRNDFLHKESAAIAKRYDLVCVESLNLAEIAAGLHNTAKPTYDNGYGTFLNMLEYKLADRGKTLIRVDKWYPSSKTCHDCGSVNHELTLDDREWTCPSCGTHHDRDFNAAMNIKEEGIRLLLDNNVGQGLPE